MAPEATISRFVVGVDGSEESAAAVDQAIRLAAATGAEVVAVHALESSHHLTRAGLYGRRAEPHAPVPNRGAEIGAFVDRWCRGLAESGLAYRTIVEAGDPAAVIETVARRLDATLVVVGRRGRGTLGELVLGSVSNRLVHHCPLPVLLVSRQAASPDRQRAAAGAAGNPS